MIFTRTKYKKNEDIQSYIEYTEIEKFYVSKFLGIVIDEKPSWRGHVAYISHKICKRTGILIKARKHFNRTTLLNLYCTFICPYIVYCNYLCGHTYDKYIEKKSIVQKSYQIYCRCKKKSRTNTDTYCENVLIINVKQIDMYVICLFIYRFHHNLLPVTFVHYFALNRNVHAYYTSQR